jgi:DNA-binding NtrC family response regulator
VLVVDDDALIRWALTETLSSGGCDVSESCDGRQAKAAVGMASRPFDVVLLDYRLPDSDDLSLLASIHAMSPDTSIIVMTAHGSGEMAQRALRLGAVRVMDKPFDLNALPGLVAQMQIDRFQAVTH